MLPATLNYMWTHLGIATALEKHSRNKTISEEGICISFKALRRSLRSEGACIKHNFHFSVQEFLAQTFQYRALPFECIALITVRACSYEFLLSSDVPSLWIRAGCRFNVLSASVTGGLLERACI
jgi:hypothetical protein